MVAWNRQALPGYFRMGLTCRTGFDTAKPGQFVMVRVGQDSRALLRRPFSILGRIDDGGRVIGFEILYKVVGEGTRCLSDCGEGDRLDVIGPLGNAFEMPDFCRYPAFVAGGVGVPPIRFLAHCLPGKKGVPEHCVVFIGARTREELVCLEEFDLPGVVLDISTDDGSMGSQGVVTRRLEQAAADGRLDLICACGPPPMLKAVARIAASYDIPCQVSIEAMMACGMGACLGCAVQVKDDNDHYRHVCIDGPVFDAGRLTW
ncbi:MAG: dihydroorotate dehydrogenase electron transfer subunit [Proteobacteria bacterium]|nr:MAG: dihydroorotate dehydrogenase electron transfer subunit [Pseudomonadota bacterium]PIE67482.1 MAG: dihydroorotate dehydrogenase electron transfer subunit [Deltaproteobacteria bacterium]